MPGLEWMQQGWGAMTLAALWLLAAVAQGTAAGGARRGRP